LTSNDVDEYVVTNRVYNKNSKKAEAIKINTTNQGDMLAFHDEISVNHGGANADNDGT
jgi:hypothetical protein